MPSLGNNDDNSRLFESHSQDGNPNNWISLEVSQLQHPEFAQLQGLLYPLQAGADPDAMLLEAVRNKDKETGLTFEGELYSDPEYDESGSITESIKDRFTNYLQEKFKISMEDAEGLQKGFSQFERDIYKTAISGSVKDSKVTVGITASTNIYKDKEGEICRATTFKNWQMEVRSFYDQKAPIELPGTLVVVNKALENRTKLKEIRTNNKDFGTLLLNNQVVGELKNKFEEVSKTVNEVEQEDNQRRKVANEKTGTKFSSLPELEAVLIFDYDDVFNTTTAADDPQAIILEYGNLTEENAGPAYHLSRGVFKDYELIKLILEILTENNILCVPGSQRTSYFDERHAYLRLSMYENFDRLFGKNRKYLREEHGDIVGKAYNERTDKHPGKNAMFPAVKLIAGCENLSNEKNSLVDDSEVHYENHAISAGYGFIHADGKKDIAVRNKGLLEALFKYLPANKVQASVEKIESRIAAQEKSRQQIQRSWITVGSVAGAVGVLGVGAVIFASGAVSFGLIPALVLAVAAIGTGIFMGYAYSKEHALSSTEKRVVRQHESALTQIKQEVERRQEKVNAPKRENVGTDSANVLQSLGVSVSPSGLPENTAKRARDFDEQARRQQQQEKFSNKPQFFLPPARELPPVQRGCLSFLRSYF